MSASSRLVVVGRPADSPTENAVAVSIVDGRVVALGAPADVPAGVTRLGNEASSICPGLVDLHVHGASGCDFADGDPAGIEEICRCHARHGTTALCATVLASAPERTLRVVELLRACAEVDRAELVAGPRRSGGARVFGVHLEGPFLNPERAGAQPQEHLRAPDPVLLEELLSAAAGTLRIVTLAPELPGALALVERLVDAGVTVSMGHSSATYEEALRGIEAGCRLGAHVFNAMSGLHHRAPGLVGALLCRDELYVEVIADGHHVAGPVLELLWRLKGAPGGFGAEGRLVLITDCTAALEAPPAAARLGDRPVRVVAGAVRLPDGTLAGSSLTMERALRNMVRLTSASFASAVAAASRTPAAVLGAAVPLGALEIGAPADFLITDRGGALEHVLVAGVVQETMEQSQ